MAGRPKSMVVALREVILGIGTTPDKYPEWFRDESAADPYKAWTTLLSSAADELEGMQKLNGKLYKTLYPD